MEQANQSRVAEFILLGFFLPPHMSLVLFGVFLVIYLSTVTANSLIIAVVQVDSRLHSPMYFFISNLSFLDVCFLSSTIPKCLEGFLAKRNIITFMGCAVQMYIGLSLGLVQAILLAVMSWDRFVAICNPLSYQRIMNRTMCFKLAIFTWTSGFLLPVLEVCLTMKTPFCGHNKIDHIVCELSAVLSLACGDIRLIEVVIFVVCIVALIIPLSIIIFAYLRIISTIVRMSASTSRHKAFSTCGSHLIVVTLFYGAAIVTYMTPKSATSMEKDKFISLFYGVVTPALNPLIYTLRNNDVKAAVKKHLCRKMVL